MQDISLLSIQKKKAPLSKHLSNEKKKKVSQQIIYNSYKILFHPNIIISKWYLKWTKKLSVITFIHKFRSIIIPYFTVFNLHYMLKHTWNSFHDWHIVNSPSPPIEISDNLDTVGAQDCKSRFPGRGKDVWNVSAV